MRMGEQTLTRPPTSGLTQWPKERAAVAGFEPARLVREGMDRGVND